jgi:hypothetical protein
MLHSRGPTLSPRGRGQGEGEARFELFTVSIFQGGKVETSVQPLKKALLPLKKGGREGFLGKLFQKVRGL